MSGSSPRGPRRRWPRRSSRLSPSLLACLLPLALAACAPDASEPVGLGDAAAPAARITGGVTRVGAATAVAFAELGPEAAPVALGVALSSDFFDELPTDLSDEHQCFDRDGDGAVARPAECNPWHEWVIPLPDEVASREDIPFKWSLMNWNPTGHIPPGIYDSPHFDVHFYIAPIEDVLAIEPGPCGPEFVRCDQYEIARRPLPPNYMPADYQDVEAVAPAMGNHLIDLTSAEFHGQPFTRTWIYGIYDGEVTYYEEMVALDYLRSRPSECFAIKSPPAVGLAGYYPTLSCLRYLPESDEYTVSMEGFEYREASPPDPIPVEAAPAAGSAR